MWFFDAALSLFSTPTDEAHLQYFRMGLGLACLMKFAVWFTHGAWSRMAPGGFGRYDIECRLGARRAAFVAAMYRPVLCMRVIAAAFLVAGILPKAAAVVVMAGLLFELQYELRSNTIYLGMMVACMLVAGNLGEGFTVIHRMSDANTWAQFLVVLITIDLYWNSAWQKTRSTHFMSGLILAQYVGFTARAQERLRYREFYYPGVFLRLFGGGDETAVRRWRVIAVAVIVLELALPIGLLTPALFPYAAAAGVVMHLAFMILLPRHLIGFSLGTVSSYIAFAQ
ncbi:hypothetical protein ACIBQ1_27525 [Nonomuraea sp. NPDC050153]|uniref:hypothetical protein n=1 Tax=Nonomuraea sp. NPDC050153 TaxID=3364359 RepID=UPI003795A4C0